jgi:hypothetical protein
MVEKTMEVIYEVFDHVDSTEEQEVELKDGTKIRAQVPVSVIQLVPTSGLGGTIRLVTHDDAASRVFHPGDKVVVTFQLQGA